MNITDLVERCLKDSIEKYGKDDSIVKMCKDCMTFFGYKVLEEINRLNFTAFTISDDNDFSKQGFGNMLLNYLVDEKDEQPKPEGKRQRQHHIDGRNAGHVFKKARFEDIAEGHKSNSSLYGFLFCSAEAAADLIFGKGGCAGIGQLNRASDDRGKIGVPFYLEDNLVSRRDRQEMRIKKIRLPTP